MILMRSTRASFPRSVEAVTAGRVWVRRTLIDWDLAELARPAELAVCELLSNAVRHAGTAPTVTVEVAEAVTVTVTDGAREVPVPQRLAALSVEESGGRGLHIVEALAQRWGVKEIGPDKAVWFRLELPRRPRTDRSGSPDTAAVDPAA